MLPPPADGQMPIASVVRGKCRKQKKKRESTILTNGNLDQKLNIKTPAGADLQSVPK